MAGVVQAETAPAYGLQHDEMIHVPVKDGRQLQLSQMLGLETNRPRR